MPTIIMADERLHLDLGKPLTAAEINQYSITVFPDGTNLPIGQGSVDQGRVLYKNQCMMCHGEEGIEGPAARLAGSDGWFSFSDPLRILRIEKHPVLLISVGSLWPYATSIFDYIRRAMPHYSPKSLDDNQVYALTAYLLYLNDLVPESAVLDVENILNVQMSGKERSVMVWPEK
ncbi:MAG: cytochrome c [Oleispira sp.]